MWPWPQLPLLDRSRDFVFPPDGIHGFRFIRENAEPDFGVGGIKGLRQKLCVGAHDRDHAGGIGFFFVDVAGKNPWMAGSKPVEALARQKYLGLCNH